MNKKLSIRGSSLGWKNRKSQLLPSLMHPAAQRVRLIGFSFKFIFNTTGVGIGEGLRSPSCPRTRSHFFLLAFSAALVVLPATSLGVVALMTPTATVCLMSLTANLPRGGNSAKGSTHMGLLGSSLTMAASPDLMNLGASSVDFPVRLSTFSKISANLQAMCAVWQSSTGEYPLDTCPGWLSTMTWAVKSETPLAGLFLESEVTYPRLMSFTDTFLMLKPTLSPGTASGRDSWCISTDLTSVERATGAKVTTMSGLITPVSTRPTGTVPMPPIL